MAITDTCRFAWNSSKKPHQPEYDALIESYRDMLTARAEAVLATKLVDDGPFAGFENAVLNAPPEPAASSDVGYEQVVDAEPFYEEGVAAPDAITQVEDIVPTKVEEPKEYLELKGHLPSNFPAYDKLHEAGINTYSQLAKVEDLTSVGGVGPATVKAIKKRLKSDAKALNG